MGYSTNSLEVEAENERQTINLFGFYISTLMTSYGIFLGHTACRDQIYKITGPYPYYLDQYGIANDWYISYEGYVNLVEAMGNIFGVIWSMTMLRIYSS
jgi:hypothetical protein